MILQHDHKVFSSVKLWTEHVIAQKGQAYSNASGFFYPVPNVYGGYYTYALPYQPIIADASISGATIMSGVYLNNTFIMTGQSGLVDINYDKGQVYFNTEITSPQTTLSGNFSIAEFNVSLTDAPEENLLFETKHFLKPKTYYPVTGLMPNDVTYPIIYIKNLGGQNEEFAFGGTDTTVNNVRLIIMSDSLFSVDGVLSILRDKQKTLMPLITEASDLPFNFLGGTVRGSYNYDVDFTGRFTSADSLHIESVDVGRLQGGAYTEFKKINPDVFIGLATLELKTYNRSPRC